MQMKDESTVIEEGINEKGINEKSTMVHITDQEIKSNHKNII